MHDRGMKLRRAFVVLSLVLACVALFWIGLQFHALQKGMERIQNHDERLLELTGTIVHLDEVLTMSARMGAATLDLAWEERYRQFEALLDEAIKESLRIEPGKMGQFMLQTDIANRRLIELENRVFELVRQKDSHAATAILLSPEYQKQKQLYAEGMLEFTATVKAGADATMNSQQRRIPFIFVLLLAVIVIIFLLWLALLRTSTRRVEAERQARQAIEQARDDLEIRVAEAKVRFSAITDCAQDAILIMDSEGRISYWNPAAESIIGHTAAEAIGKKLHEFIVPHRFHAAHLAAFPEFQRTGTGAAVGKTLELQALRKDGQEIDVALSLSAVQIQGAWHAVGIIRDITNQKRAAGELHRSKEELAHRNAQLQVSIEHANQMTIEAQEANIAKSQFLANMSHEIRTPMNGVIGMTGLLIDTNLSEEQRRYAEVVRSSGEALLSVINDILDFSKIESGKLEFELLNFDLRTMIEDTAELLAINAQEKNLEFIFRIDPEVPTFLQGDPGRLRQILVNLGGNAIKFTSHGEVVIEVRLESEFEDQIKARFEVRDTGIGIPQEKLCFLFDAFQQADNSVTRRYGGTGLGLAISKRLVELMGGEIGIESAEGQGSIVWFTVVLGKQPPGQRGEETPHADIYGVRALAVDDNATNRLVLAEQLTSWGVRHAEAESAMQALDMLHAAYAEGDPFRIVLTDMQMPDMDGESLGEAIKAAPNLRDTILMMMTSLGKRGDAKRLAAIGFSAYLTKPVKQSQLYDCLSTALGAVIAPVNASETGLITRHSISEARRRKIRILLAEDNPTNQQVALRVLEKMGFRADVVANGREAIGSLESLPYDIVFMDVQMPVMDGFEATRAIRSGKTKARNPRIPIIAMTAHAMKGDRERCIEMGMDDYIPKPISSKALAAALDKWLGHDTQESPSVSTVPTAPINSVEQVAVFDRQSLDELLMGDEDLVKEIIKGFLKDMPLQIDTLKKHITRGDARKVGHQGHAIKGAAANTRCMALCTVASNIEKAGMAGKLEEIVALVPELDQQFDLVKTQMQEDGS